MNGEGVAPIYLGATSESSRTEICAKRYVKPGQWNTNRGKANGTSEDGKSINPKDTGI